MAKYVIELDEKTARGKAIKMLLETEDGMRLMSVDEFEIHGEKILVREMKKADKTKLLDYAASKKEFAKLKAA